MSSAQEPMTNLADYITEINKIAVPNDDSRYIYRGQKNETWHIQSGAIRRLQKEPLEQPDLLPYLFKGYIHQIIDEVQLRYSSVYNNLTALECMAHLQHNRVATGLIDFTYNPLVALWFACETDGATDGKVFVVNVQPDKVREVKTKGALGQKLKTFFEADGQWYLWQPSIDNSAVDTQRITMQQSVFLFGLSEVEPSMIEREVLIPKEHKETLLQELETMGISEKTLFSDLAGFFERNTTESTYNRDLAEDYYTEEIRKAEAQGNKSGENYFQRANVRAALGKYQEAIADYDATLRLNPQPAPAYFNRGLAKVDLGKYEEAIGDFDAVLRLNPQDAMAYFNRGFAKDSLGRHQDAVVDYDEALRLNPQNVDTSFNRGLAKDHLGKYKEAIADYDVALRLNPQDAVTYYRRGIAKGRLDRHEEAIADLDEALRLNPQLASAYYNRGLAKSYIEHHEDALADYDATLRLKPQYTEAYNSRGLAKSRLGQNEEAVRDLDEALRLNPQLASAYYNRGLAKGRLKRYEEARADLQHALELTIKQDNEELARLAQELLNQLPPDN